MAFFHVQKVNHLYLIATHGKQCARIPKQLAFTVQHKKGCVCLKQIHFRIEAAFTGTAAAHTNGIEITPVFSAVQTHAKVLCKDAVCKRVTMVAILFIDCSDIAPSGRAVFFPSAVVAPGGKENTDTQAISA